MQLIITTTRGTEAFSYMSESDVMKIINGWEEGMTNILTIVEKHPSMTRVMRFARAHIVEMITFDDPPKP